MAERLSLALVVSAIDRATRPLQAVAGGVSKVSARLNRLSDAGRRAGRALTGLGMTALTRLTLPLGAISGFALRAFGTIEQMTVGFESMLGGAGKAARMVMDLTRFAARTPFQLVGIGQATRMLLAAGVAGKDVTDRLGMLGDIAAGAQVPLTDMAQIYQKSMSKGKVQTEELNQLAERGVPIMDALVELQRRYGNEISKDDVYKAAEKGQIKFRHLEAALRILTEEGGIFHKQMEKQSQTLFGIYSTLKDNIFNALAVVGRKLAETFKVKENMQRLILFIQELTAGFERFTAENPRLSDFLIILAGIAAAAGPALILLGGVAFAFSLMAAGLAVVLSPIALVLIGIAALAAGAWLVVRNWEGIGAFFERVWQDIEAAFPDTAAFFEGHWTKASKPVPGIFDWVKTAWSAALSWITGLDAGSRLHPAEREEKSVFDWLMEPVDGAFRWVGDKWDTAVAAVAAAPAAALGWVTDGIEGAFEWLFEKWQLERGILERVSLEPVIGWVNAGGIGNAFGWVGERWDAAIAAVAAAAAPVVGWVTDGIDRAFEWMLPKWQLERGIIERTIEPVIGWVNAGGIRNAFGWVGERWDAAIAAVAAAAAPVVGWVTDGIDRAFEWMLPKWQLERGIIEGTLEPVIGWVNAGGIRNAFGWVRETWDAALTWIMEDRPGIFNWVKENWTVALRFVGLPVIGTFAWLTRDYWNGSTFAWVLSSWDSVLADIQTSRPEIWNWLRGPDDEQNLFEWIGAGWNAATASLGFAFPDVSEADAARWVSSLFAALTTGVEKTPSGEVGMTLGENLRAAVDWAVNSMVSDEGFINQAAEGLGKFLVALIGAATKAAGGLILGFFRDEIQAVDDFLARSYGDDYKSQPLPSMMEGTLEPAPRSVVPIYGRPGQPGNLDRHQTLVGGEVVVRFKGAPPGTVVENIRSDNDDVDIVSDLGYAMGGA